MKAWIASLLAAVGLVYSQSAEAQITLIGGKPPECTVAELAAETCGTREARQTVEVTDAASRGTCTTGGGTERVRCLWNPTKAQWETTVGTTQAPIAGDSITPAEIADGTDTPQLNDLVAISGSSTSQFSYLSASEARTLVSVFSKAELQAGACDPLTEIQYGVDTDGSPLCAANPGGSGSSLALDLASNGQPYDSDGLTRIDTTGDTNLIFSESPADVLRIDVANNWPTADTSADVTCTDCLTATEIQESTLESPLEALLDLPDLQGTLPGNRVEAGSTSARGTLQIATDGEASSSSEVVSSTDSRMDNARQPTGAATGDLSGTYPSPTVAANAVALGTDTTGNYVASVTDGDGLTGGDGGSESAALTLGLDYSATLAANPGLAVDRCVFVALSSGGGFLCEGSTADGNEMLFLFPDENESDTTRRILIDTAAQTITNKTISSSTNQLDLSAGVTVVGIIDDQIVLGDGAGTTTYLTIPDCNTNNMLTYDQATNTLGCDADDGAGGGAPVGVQYVVGASDATLTAEKILTDGTGIDTVLSGGDAGSATINLDYTATLAGDPALAVGQCVFTSSGNGGILCEGADDTSEGLLAFNPAGEVTVTIPGATTDTLVARDTTDTLTNKTIDTASNTIAIAAADISDQDAGTDITADLEEEGVTCTDCIDLAKLDDDVGSPVAGDLLSVRVGATDVAYVTLNAGTDVTADLEEEAHASEHKHLGTDEIATATAGANAIPKAGAGGDLDNDWIPYRTAATDCTAETGGVLGEHCWELDDNTIYACETATCDAAGWQATTATAGAHTLGGASHTADTLANLNTKVSDATLDDVSDSRPPSGAASGSLSGTYPNPGIATNAVTATELASPSPAPTPGTYGNASNVATIDVDADGRITSASNTPISAVTQWADENGSLRPADAADDCIRVSGDAGAPRICSLDGSTFCIDTDDDTGTCEVKIDATGRIIGIDQEATGGNRVQILDHDQNVTPDPTCAEKGTSGTLTILDVDESAADVWQLCDGTSILFDFTSPRNPVIYADDFDGDGTHDATDLTAALAACSSAGGGIVMLPPRTPATGNLGTTQFTNPGSCKLACTGQSCQVVWDHTSAGNSAMTVAGDFAGCQDVQFIVNNTHADTIALDLDQDTTGVREFGWDRCYVRGATTDLGIGVRMEYALKNRFIGGDIQNFGIGLQLNPATGPLRSNANDIRMEIRNNDTGVQVTADSCRTLSLAGSTVEGNDVANLDLDGDCTVNLDGTHLEAEAGADAINKTAGRVVGNGTRLDCVDSGSCIVSDGTASQDVLISPVLVNSPATQFTYETGDGGLLYTNADIALVNGGTAGASALRQLDDAAGISNTATGGVSATDVQGAIDELDTEKAPLASPDFTGTITLPAIDGVASLTTSTPATLTAAELDVLDGGLAVGEITGKTDVVLQGAGNRVWFLPESNGATPDQQSGGVDQFEFPDTADTFIHGVLYLQSNYAQTSFLCRIEVDPDATGDVDFTLTGREVAVDADPNDFTTGAHSASCPAVNGTDRQQVVCTFTANEFVANTQVNLRFGRDTTDANTSPVDAPFYTYCEAGIN